MTRAGLQVDERLPTGRVKVSLLDGEPSYDIVHPSAWDAIEAPGVMPELQLLYHGSLALRSDVSKRTCRQIRNSSPGLVFVDVNLRAPWWSIEQVREDILGADWIKMNREEFDILMPGGSGVLARAEKALIDHELQGILLTDGSRGAELLTVGGEHESVQPANGLEVVDTVGAGDAMASVVVLGLLRGWPLGPCLEQAQVFASMIVGQRGATIRDSHFYQSFIDRCISRGLDI